jgi:hypothetical protein
LMDPSEMWTVDRLLGLQSNSIPSKSSLIVFVAKLQSCAYPAPQ